MRFASRLVALCVLLVMPVLALSAAAQTGTDENASIPEVNITITDEGFEVPESIPAGIVHLVYDNQTEAPASPEFLKLNEGVTSDDVLAAFATDPFAAFALVTMMGGTEIAPETTTTLTYDLEEGEYVFFNFTEESPEPQVYHLSAVAAETDLAELPEPDVTINMADFVFGIPSPLEAGETLWQIENLGTQWHEMVIAPIEEGTTLEEAAALVQEAIMAENPEEASLIPTFMWSPMGEGQRAWATIDLEPGTYIIVCTLPDLTSETGESHLDHGMIQLFSVE